ncbi:MAG: polysaccharide biosynthesis tyrosine autokinase, partial [Pyrinomonadaceae bacterium]
SLPSIYEAVGTLRLEPKSNTFLQDGHGSVYQAYNNYDYTNTNTQIRLLSNPQLMRQVVLALDLQHNPAFLADQKTTGPIAGLRGLFVPSGNSAVEKKPGPSIIGGEQKVEDLTPEQSAQLEPYVAVLLSNLKVEPAVDTSLVTLRFTHTNPDLAQQVVDTLQKTFIANENQYETKGSQTAAETLSKQVADLQLKIRQQEEARLTYLGTHNLPLGEGQGRNLTSDRLGIISAQLLAAENERKIIEANYESARAAKDVWSIPQVRESKDILETRKLIRDLEQKRASLVQVYTTEWAEVKKLDAEIAELKANIDQSARETVSAMKSSLDAALARENKLRDAYFKEQGAANSQSQDQIGLSNLTQQIETSKQLYLTLFQRQKEMEINATDDSDRVSIATLATLPTAPVGPPRFGKVAIAFMVSLFAGLGLVILLQQLDNTFKSVEDIATHTHLPTLALIPAVHRGGLSAKGRRLFKGRQSESRALSLTGDVRSPTAEAYRHLRTSLLFTSPGGAPKSILVTSGRPLEGKTTTAVSIAITFAQTGAEVLLLDCDLRQPRVHFHFDLSNAQGLTSYLSGQQDIGTLWHVPADHPTLKVLTSGPRPANPADFLGSNEMRQLLEELRDRFAYIIVDSPPASTFADAGILSTLLDGVMIVVHSERSSRLVVQRVKNRLEELGAHIYGIVLNHVDLQSDDYYSGYYSSYYQTEYSDATEDS